MHLFKKHAQMCCIWEQGHLLLVSAFSACEWEAKAEQLQNLSVSSAIERDFDRQFSYLIKLNGMIHYLDVTWQDKATACSRTTGCQQTILTTEGPTPKETLELYSTLEEKAILQLESAPFLCRRSACNFSEGMSVCRLCIYSSDLCAAQVIINVLVCCYCSPLIFLRHHCIKL